MKHKRKLSLYSSIIVSLLFFGLMWGIQELDLSKARAFALAVEAYIYGYPLVLAKITEQVMTSALPPYGARVNTFNHVPRFPTPAEKQVVTPNADTLYSLAWLDLSQGPLVLQVPNTHGRYYVLPILDAWTNVVASLGKRTTGTKEASFILVGPFYQGKLPKNRVVIKIPTNMAWIIGRIQTNGVQDYPYVHVLQKGFSISPFSTKRALSIKDSTAIDLLTPPVEQVARMDTLAFFALLTSLMIDNLPAPADTRFIKQLAHLGITPGKLYKAKLIAMLGKNLALVPAAAQNIIRRAAERGAPRVNGWRLKLKGIGRYGTDYLGRAAVAAIGLGANVPQDAVYAAAQVDGDNQKLSGAHCYVMHFSKENIPPVHAFWSLSLYNNQQFFVPNSLNRYALGDRDDLVYNPDGSLDIYMQYAEPKGKLSNWLPAPRDGFNVVMRLYWPKQKVLTGAWKPSPIKKRALCSKRKL